MKNVNRILQDFVKPFFLTATLLACSLAALSQRPSVKGVVVDTFENKQIANSVVSLLRKSDSVLVKFARTDALGKFNLPTSNKGQYFLLVTHPNFADFFTDIELTGSSAVDLGRISMTTKAQLLQEVVVTQQLGAIRRNKDTVEYVADSFKVAAHAKVEDLLRRLPGVRVDNNGKIITQGEEVKQVLVDGEEFFGNDPTMATQNLRADIVDKVQVFDKKSEEATFTGIDDGKRTKTINLKLKEDKKNGYFGKLIAGGGLPDKFVNQAMFNSFKDKRKLAAFGTSSNTVQTGLGYGDLSNYGGYNADFTDVDLGEIREALGAQENSDGFSGTFAGEGLPTSWSGGLNYSNKYDEAKHALNGTWRFNKLNTAGSGTATSQFLLPDTTYYRNERGNNNRSRLGNNVSAGYKVQLDSVSTLQITANGMIETTKHRNYSFAESLNEEKNRINESSRAVSNNADNQEMNFAAAYRRKFKKTGRTISVLFNQEHTDKSSESYLLSNNIFYDPAGQIVTQDSINQQRKADRGSSILAGKIIYTESIFKSLSVNVSYMLAGINSQSERATLAYENGKYSDFIDSLSTDYRLRILTNRAHVGFHLKKSRKIFASAGSDISYSAFRQQDRLRNTSLTYSYLNLFPLATFSYMPSPGKRMSLFYRGNTRQPSIDQLQSLNDNTDPLNIYRGNPDLKQEFTHDLNFSYTGHNSMTGYGLVAELRLSATDNAIGTAEYFDATLGKRIYQPVNVNGNYTANGSLNYDFGIKKINLSMGVFVSGNYMQNNTIVNNIKNTTGSDSYGAGIHLGHYGEKFRMGASSSILRNNSSSSINKQIKTSYWSSSISSNATLILPAKIEIGTTADIDLREKTALFDRNRNVVKWNANISKKLTKNEALALSFEVMDILNNNIGFSRDISSTYITERTYDILRRFWLLKLSWDFNKQGKGKQ